VLAQMQLFTISICNLSTATKVRVYQALIMSVLLYIAETWTLFSLWHQSFGVISLPETNTTSWVASVRRFVRRLVSQPYPALSCTVEHCFGHIVRVASSFSAMTFCTQRKKAP